MWKALKAVGGVLHDLVRSRADLVLENAFLRQLIVVLVRRKKCQARPEPADRVLLSTLARLLPEKWRDLLAVAQWGLVTRSVLSPRRHCGGASVGDCVASRVKRSTGKHFRRRRPATDDAPARRVMDVRHDPINLDNRPPGVAPRREVACGTHSRRPAALFVTWFGRAPTLFSRTRSSASRSSCS
jgi:hypothetical protein